MGLIGCIGCSLPSSCLDERVGCFCTSIKCDWIIKFFVNVASKDVTSLPFFAKTLILITLNSCKLSQQEPCCSHRVVAIINSGAPKCNSFAKLVASLFNVDCQDLLFLQFQLPKSSSSFLLIANYPRMCQVYTTFCYA